MIPSEETLELLDRIHDLQAEIELWRERAEAAEGFEKAVLIAAEARDLAGQSKRLLDHTIAVVEEHTPHG